jgi:hypothetical protein
MAAPPPDFDTIWPEQSSNGFLILHRGQQPTVSLRMRNPDNVPQTWVYDLLILKPEVHGPSVSGPMYKLSEFPGFGVWSCVDDGHGKRPQLTTPARTSVTIDISWPQTDLTGQPAPYGRYKAVLPVQRDGIGLGFAVAGLDLGP